MDEAFVEVEAVEKDPRLSELSTQWTMLFQAHHGTPEQMTDALRIMMLRYEGAVHRYFLKAVGDPEVVRELDQEFALRFLKGKFLKYDPKLGRFRDYVKRAVRNLMMDYHRQKGKTQRLDTDLRSGGRRATRVVDEIDEQIITAWRDELLDRAWNALEDLEKRTGQPHHTILKYRARNPDLELRRDGQRTWSGSGEIPFQRSLAQPASARAREMGRPARRRGQGQPANSQSRAGRRRTGGTAPASLLQARDGSIELRPRAELITEFQTPAGQILCSESERFIKLELQLDWSWIDAQSSEVDGHFPEGDDMPAFSRDVFRRYGFAIFLVGLAVALRLVFYPVLGDRYPFFLFFVAIVLAAGYGGYGPSLRGAGSLVAVGRLSLC